jgi:site-specific DNA-methyltransferase (adenine-specific)
LNEYDVFIRRNEALSILRKVLALEEPKFSARVSALKPFGLRTHFHGRTKKTSKDKIKLHGSGAISWVSKGEIEANRDWVDRWKVLIAAATDGNENYPLPIWDQKGPFVAGPGEACTETYLVASLASSESEAKRIVEYMRTKFFRFLVSLRKIAQHNKSDNFAFVPDLSTARKWTDEQLIKTYGLTSEETHFIDSIIRPMPSFDE